MSLTHADVAKIMVDATPKLIDVIADYFEDEIPAIVAQASKDAVTQALLEKMPRELHVVRPDHTVRVIPRAHHKLELIVKVLMAGVRPFLVGPAGSGKTTLAMQCAEALDLPFGMASRVSHEMKLFGYMDANGNYHRTQFRDRYEHGGVFLLDEITAGEGDVMTSINAAIANGHADFPDGMVAKSPNFYLIAADNTFGLGGDRIYAGRNQLDGATLDRFAFFEIGYDELLERELAQNDAWVDRVHEVRRAVQRERIQVIVGPRASMDGAKMLAIGIDWQICEEAVLWKSMDSASRARVERK